jgi:hypothetical protein
MDTLAEKNIFNVGRALPADTPLRYVYWLHDVGQCPTYKK